MINLISNDWQIENIDTVLFDKDGTFIDLHYFWGKMTEMRVLEIINRYHLPQNLFKELCLKLGYDVDEQKMLKEGITALYSRVKIIEIFKQDLMNYGLDLSYQDIEKIFDEVSQEFYKNIIEYTKPIESAIEFIKKLRNRGIKLGIVTSDSIESSKLTLKYFGWEYLFDVVIGRESCEFTKESGEPTKLALTQLGADPKRAVMIGDAPMDYISAKNAGIENIILVSTGQLRNEDLKLSSEFVLNNLSQLEIN